MLSYRPSQFFNELDKTSDYKASTLKNAYWRAKKEGYIYETNGLASLSKKGQAKLRPFTTKNLRSGAKLMVIFDVPEDQASKRRKLRDTLKLWEFTQVQKSVWVSDRDYKELLVELMAELRLSGAVEIYEANCLYPDE